MIPKTVTIAFPSAYEGSISRLTIIKSLRVLGGMGLLEAKNLTENKGQSITLNVVVSDLLESETGRLLNTAQERFNDAVRDLRINECVVVHDNPLCATTAIDLIWMAVDKAVLSRRVDMAGDLLDILRKYQ